MRHGLPFLRDRPPRIVDWLPWNHTFGSNHNFNLVLDNGGSFYIDEGKPLPGAIAATVLLPLQEGVWRGGGLRRGFIPAGASAATATGRCSTAERGALAQ